MAAAYVCVAVPALGDDAPNVATIEAHVREAEGPPLASYRETLDEIVAGTRYRETFVRRGDDYRTTVDEGPVRDADGAYRGQRWRQNENGETILEAPDPGYGARDTYASTVRSITEPVVGYVIASLNAAGFGTKRYVDSATWRIVRWERIGAAGIVRTDYDDFRTIGGRAFAFHETTHDAAKGDDSERRNADIRASAVADAELAIPQSTRTLVEFPAGRSRVDLPVRIEHSRLLARVNVGGRDFDMLLDSGAAGISLEDGVVARLGIATFGTVSNGSNAGRFRQSTAVVPLMKVGDLTMRDVVVRTVPRVEAPSQLNDYRAVGLLGFDFIDAVALKVDYYDGTATAYLPAAFVPPAAPRQFDVDIRLGSGVPMTTVSVNGAIGERFIIDTGARATLIVFAQFARRNPAALADEERGPKPEARMNGIGGQVAVSTCELKDVRFGTVDFRDVPAFVVTQRGAYDAGSDGLFGTDFLRRFDVTLDYAHAKAYFAFHDVDPGAEKS